MRSSSGAYYVGKYAKDERPVHDEDTALKPIPIAAD